LGISGRAGLFVAQAAIYEVMRVHKIPARSMRVMARILMRTLLRVTYPQRPHRQARHKPSCRVDLCPKVREAGQKSAACWHSSGNPVVQRQGSACTRPDVEL